MKIAEEILNEIKEKIDPNQFKASKTEFENQKKDRELDQLAQDMEMLKLTESFFYGFF